MLLSSSYSLLTAIAPDIRHLGKLHSLASVKELKLAILVEMVTRCLKVNLRKRWRSHTIKYPSAEDESYKRVTVRYLNQVLGRSDKTSLYWTFELLPQVMAKFEDALTPEEQTELGKAASSDCIMKMEISKRLEQLCGIEYSTKLADKFERDPEWFLQEFPIPELHVVRIHPVIKTTNTIPFMEGLLLLHSQGLESSTSAKAAADRFWVLQGAAKKFKESLERVPGGRAEILALASVQYERAFYGLPIAQSVRILDNSQHTLEYLLEAYPNDPEAFLLYADVVHLSGRMRNNASILQTAASYYKKHLDAYPDDPRALYQCGQCLLRLYYLECRSLDHLAASLKCSTRAVDLRPHDGDAWALLARTMAIKTANDPDPALFAVCDDAFSRTFLYMLEHRNSDVMYRWATYVLHKAISFDNVDLLLVGTMKLKAAVEKEVKPEYFTAMRSCIHTIREKLKNEESDSRWSTSTVAMVSSWLKVLKQAVLSMDQRCDVIPWDDIDLMAPLSSSEFHFLYKARWYDYHGNDGSAASRDSSEPASPAPELAKSSSDSLSESRSNSTSAVLRGSVSQSLFKRLREKKFTLRTVVIKLVTKGIAIQADKDRWANELRVMQHFENPPEQLLRLHGRTYDDHHEGLVIEYIQGLPVLERLQLMTYSTPMSMSADLRRSQKWKFITSIAHQTAIGLDYMHNSNVLWAAVSPRNLLVDDKGGVKLTNFEASQIISTEDPLGDLSFRAEVINFGGFLWELAAGEYRPEDHRLGALAFGADWPEAYTTAIKICNLSDNDSLGSVGEIAEQLALAAAEFK
jgi:tetratricopeptide (TPR) repeat protein